MEGLGSGAERGAVGRALPCPPRRCSLRMGWLDQGTWFGRDGYPRPTAEAAWMVGGAELTDLSRRRPQLRIRQLAGKPMKSGGGIVQE